VQTGKVVAKTTGATIEALAADQASIWGLRPFFAVADELTQCAATPAPERVWDGLASAKTAGTPHRRVRACDSQARITRTLDSHASRVRRKLQANGHGPFVINVWGVGRGVERAGGSWREVAWLLGFRHRCYVV